MARNGFPKTVKVYTDGCAKGNPGPAAAGFVFEDIHGEVLEEGCAALGTATNNEAEYEALIKAMERCLELGVNSAFFFTDSQLMARQLNGVYKIKNPRIAKLASRAMALRRKFKQFQITDVPRTANTRADALANQGLRGEQAGAEQ
jgi:ribonuclease HI